MAQSGTISSGIDVQPQGPRLFDPNPVTNGVANDTGKNSQYGITASTVQTLAGAQATAQLQYGVNDIAVCANSADSVAAPPAVKGTVCHYNNSGAQTSKLFAGDGDTINGTAGATGITGAAAGKMGILVCAEDGKWLHGVTA